jgi:fucose permease
MTPTSYARQASWNERGSTTALFLVLGIGFGAWAAALPSLKANLGLTDRDISVALLSLSLGSVLATLAAGWVAPRFGTGRVASCAGIAFCVTALLPPLAGALPSLIGLAAVFGVANGLFDVSINGHASEVERRWGAPIMSSFHGAFSLGGLIGATAAGLLIGAGLPPATTVAILAGTNLAIVAAALPHLGPGSRSEPEEAGLSWPNPAVLTLSAIGFCCLIIEGAMADWSGIYLATVVHVSDAVSATGYAAFSITMMVGRFAGDWVVRHLGAGPIVLWGSLIAGLGVAISVAFPALLPASLGFLLVGAGLSNVVPAVFSAAGRFGQTPSAGIAAVAGIGYSGFICGPPIIGAVASWTDLRVALGSMILIALAGVGCCLRVDWTGARAR